MLKKRKIVTPDEDLKFCIPILKYLCDPSLSTLLLDDAT